ncbi:DUF192 domain-containing protein [Kordiimonas aestuarii]|uniref:DUF192 domain-containing protein n=1 Tax=Kordiimonas aestuarii TaxID=1005925 RepID=UPI0021CEFFCF|nr:DUF192 domain-containing protein [Kordiimonas aestuarii]
MSKARMMITAVLLCFLAVPACAGPASDDQTVTVETSSTSHRFTVELALNDQERARGLMYREELEADKGMLFIFDDSAPRSFWMRNTYIPLDIIFIRADGRILNIVREARPRTDTPRQSVGRAIAVLEIAGGRAAELAINAGDYVRHPLIDGWQAR